MTAKEALTFEEWWDINVPRAAHDCAHHHYTEGELKEAFKAGRESMKADAIAMLAKIIDCERAATGTNPAMVLADVAKLVERNLEP